MASPDLITGFGQEINPFRKLRKLKKYPLPFEGLDGISREFQIGRSIRGVIGIDSTVFDTIGQGAVYLLPQEEQRKRDFLLYNPDKIALIQGYLMVRGEEANKLEEGIFLTIRYRNTVFLSIPEDSDQVILNEDDHTFERIFPFLHFQPVLASNRGIYVPRPLGITPFSLPFLRSRNLSFRVGTTKTLPNGIAE